MFKRIACWLLWGIGLLAVPAKLQAQPLVLEHSYPTDQVFRLSLPQAGEVFAWYKPWAPACFQVHDSLHHLWRSIPVQVCGTPQAFAPMFLTEGIFTPPGTLAAGGICYDNPFRPRLFILDEQGTSLFSTRAEQAEIKFQRLIVRFADTVQVFRPDFVLEHTYSGVSAFEAVDLPVLGPRYIIAGNDGKIRMFVTLHIELLATGIDLPGGFLGLGVKTSTNLYDRDSGPEYEVSWFDSAGFRPEWRLIQADSSVTRSVSGTYPQVLIRPADTFWVAPNDTLPGGYDLYRLPGLHYERSFEPFRTALTFVNDKRIIAIEADTLMKTVYFFEYEKGVFSRYGRPLSERGWQGAIGLLRSPAAALHLSYLSLSSLGYALIIADSMLKPRQVLQGIVSLAPDSSEGLPLCYRAVGFTASLDSGYTRFYRWDENATGLPAALAPGIYPNPFTKHLNIKPETPGKALLYDLNGRLMLVQEFKGPGTLHVPEHLPPGLYLLEWRSGESRHFIRILRAAQ